MQTCLNCGQYVTPTFARVFGDNEDTVHACPNCASMRTIMESGAARSLTATEGH